MHFFSQFNKKDNVQHLSLKVFLPLPKHGEAITHTSEFQVDDQPATNWDIEVNKTAPHKDSRAIHGRVMDTQHPNPQTPFFFVGQVDSDGIADLHLYRDL